MRNVYSVHHRVRRVHRVSFLNKITMVNKRQRPVEASEDQFARDDDDVPDLEHDDDENSVCDDSSPRSSSCACDQAQRRRHVLPASEDQEGANADIAGEVVYTSPDKRVRIVRTVPIAASEDQCEREVMRKEDAEDLLKGKWDIHKFKKEKNKN